MALNFPHNVPKEYNVPLRRIKIHLYSIGNTVMFLYPHLISFKGQTFHTFISHAPRSSASSGVGKQNPMQANMQKMHRKKQSVLMWEKDLELLEEHMKRWVRWV